MKPALSTLTVTFEDPFWIGLYEREEDGQYQVCKILFGAEPKDAQVYAFLQRHWRDLTFSPPLPAETAVRPRPNPKRLQRAKSSWTRRPWAPKPSAPSRPSGKPTPKHGKPGPASSGQTTRPGSLPCANRNAGKSTGATEPLPREALPSRGLFYRFWRKAAQGPG